MKTITRKEAIELLSKEQLNVLDKDTRESYILNWWVLDEDDLLVNQLDDYSCPNHATLAQAKSDFLANLHDMPLFKYRSFNAEKGI